MPKKKRTKVQPDVASDASVINRTIKASVFTDLFGQPKFALRFYRKQHPEDTTTQESDIKIITISNILTDNLYNDLGFMVGDKLMVLAEHQTKWTVNILPRVFLYLGHSWEICLTKLGYDLHSTAKVPLPKPELYMVYTGERKARPKQISLNEEFWGDKDYVVDLRIKVLYGERKNDIVSQYVEFTHICDGQIELYGRTEKAIREIFRICRERNVLTEYLNEREQEIAKIMFTVFDAEEAVRMHDRRVAQENEIAVKKAEEKGKKEGKKEGEKEGKQAKMAEIALRMLAKGTMPFKEISEYTGLSVAAIAKLAKSMG